MPVAYLAVDLETTGLEPGVDQILEVAWAPLDAQFNRLAPTQSMVVEMTPASRALLMQNEYARNMHQANGLIADSLAGGLPLSVVEKVIQASADTWVWAEPQLTVFGSSVHFDLGFIKAHMPDLAKWLHYRCLDVTTLISFARAAGAWQDEDRAIAHRAADDIDWSIAAAQKIYAALARQEVTA